MKWRNLIACAMVFGGQIFSLGMLRANENSNPILKIESISFGGTGCPGGTVPWSYSAEDGLIELELNYMAQTSEANLVDRKACALAAPVTVASGYQAGFRMKKMVYQAMIPVGGEGNIRTEIFFAGSRGPVYERTLGVGSYEGDLGSSEVIWGACGQQFNLRANTSVMVKSSEHHESAWAKLGPEVNFEIVFRRCGGGR
ncbi:MAG: DUF4360 domain-containing protein [Oligoflexia bacterium]|nr:DUF4360 domain-containing protein [Oligoflexia bacterium]MBF0365894.1 DUF4360 domain-containing protein [Oligoflexia bacterium]